MEPIGAEEEREVRRVMRWLMPGDPIGEAAARRLIGFEPEVRPAALGSLLRSGRGWWRRRWLAAWLLGRSHLDPGQRTDAESALMMAAAAGGWRNASGCLAAAGCVLVPTAVLPVPLWLTAFGAGIQYRRRQSIRAAAVDALGRIESRNAVAMLLAVTQQDPRVYPSGGPRDLWQAMTRALPRVLGRVKESDYGRLPETVTPHLAAIARQAPEPVAVAALGALERAGDGRAADAVARIARGRRQSERRSAAVRALAALVPRREREREAALLLRPASAPDSPDQILLRPAGPAPVDEDVLLRAVLPPEQESAEASLESGAEPAVSLPRPPDSQTDVEWIIPRSSADGL